MTAPLTPKEEGKAMSERMTDEELVAFERNVRGVFEPQFRLIGNYTAEFIANLAAELRSLRPSSQAPASAGVLTSAERERVEEIRERVSDGTYSGSFETDAIRDLLALTDRLTRPQ